jgi:rubredoxin
VKKYKCSVCGFIYDEAVGDPDKGIEPGTNWASVPEQWNCPLCSAEKSDFVEQNTETLVPHQRNAAKNQNHSELRHSNNESEGEISALFSNLSKGFAKQYRVEEADLFDQLAAYYRSKSETEKQGKFEDLLPQINVDLASGYPEANAIATNAKDRGALRALVWGEKVTRILSSTLSRYEKQHDAFIENTHVYVCDICGFVFVGDQLPDICPVCKVPKSKITEVKRG